MRLKTLLLTLLATWLSTASAGDTFMVLLDNSQSVTGQSGYIADIMDIMRVRGDNEYLFAPIGDGGPIKPASSPEELGALFTFKDQFTRIDASLARMEALPQFANTREILIVSDMDPDSKFFKGSDWCFNKDDIQDLTATMGRLEGWLKQDKHVTIALHYWPQVASKYISDESLALKQVHDALDKRAREIAASTACASERTSQSNRAEREDNKLLVETVVRSLWHAYPDKVKLYNIARNEQEGFIGLLCGRLNVNDYNEDVCVKPEKKEFAVAVAFDRQLSVGNRNAEAMKHTFPDDIYVPERRLIPRNRLAVMAELPAKQTLIENKYDYAFVVMPGGSGQPYYRPKIVSYAIKANEKALERLGSEILSSSDPQTMLSRVTDRVYNLLNEYIRTDFPAPKPGKKIIVTDHMNHPIPAGYSFFIRTTYSGSSQPIVVDSRAPMPDSDGSVSVRIPKSNDASNDIYLDLGKDSAAVRLGKIEPKSLKGRTPIRFALNENQYHDLALSYAMENGATPVNAVGLRVYLNNFDDLREIIPSATSTTGSRKLHLLPGRYRLEAVPSGDGGLRLLARSDIISIKDAPETLTMAFQADPLYSEMGKAPPPSWDGLNKWLDHGLLNNEGIMATEGSAYVLAALLRYTSTALKGGRDSKEMKDKGVDVLWEQLMGQIFGPNKKTTQRLLGRAMKQIQLTGEFAAYDFQFVEAMFNLYLKQPNSLEGTSDDQIKRRRLYNDWIRAITDRESGNGFISEALATQLKAKQPKKQPRGDL